MDNITYSDFCGDAEKMADFRILTKEEFLFSYSYLTEEEYDLTAARMKGDNTMTTKANQFILDHYGVPQEWTVDVTAERDNTDHWVAYITIADPYYCDDDRHYILALDGEPTSDYELLDDVVAHLNYKLN